MTAIANLDVHGHRADCHLGVRGSGLVDNGRLFLARLREGRAAEKNRVRGGERERKGERKEDRKMLWATKQLISLNLGTLHNTTAHYHPIRLYNGLLTEVY